MSQLGREEEVLLASSRWRPEMLPNILKHTGQMPTTRVYPAKMSLVSRLRNPGQGGP